MESKEERYRNCIGILIFLHIIVVAFTILSHFYPEAFPTLLCIGPSLCVAAVALYDLLRGILDLIWKV